MNPCEKQKDDFKKATQDLVEAEEAFKQIELFERTRGVLHVGETLKLSDARRRVANQRIALIKIQNTMNACFEYYKI